MKLRSKLKRMIIRLFYHVKPFIPRGIQLFVRQFIASRMRKAYADIWPIDQSAGKKPAGWGGWPDNKCFALVFMHDVDTKIGQDNSLWLAEMELKFGIKSCFYFVPERYEISSAIQQKLRDMGFEIGIHGLRHDGTLFSSLKKFTIQSKEINRYIKEWGICGFSSPSMHHNLAWIHALDIDYDISTFDTDPFEPQSDGVGTIFPFKVESGSSSRSYIELPYTLPQDFTLYTIMRERGISIWKRKLDWIVRQGGMALLNTHPDYMNFDMVKCFHEQYPAHYFEEFIRYVQSEYKDQFWQPLPREMAAFWRKTATVRIIATE